MAVLGKDIDIYMKLCKFMHTTTSIYATTI
jgi:hypothetical protein